MQLPLAPPHPLVPVPPPEPTAPSTSLTNMIVHTGPRKLQINPVSVLNQQLQRETEGVGACLRLLTLQLITPAPPSALTEGKIRSRDRDKNSHDRAGRLSVFSGPQQILFLTFFPVSVPEMFT